MTRIQGVLPVAIVAFSACGGPAMTEWTGTVTDSAGISIVNNPSEGIWTDAERWMTREELRIGTADGDPDYQFGQISGIGVASDGKIFVLDQQSAEVRVFDQSGSLISRFGRQGAGPGEIRGIGSGPLIVARGDRIVVPDLGNQRIQFYSTSGDDLGSMAVDPLKGMPMQWSSTLDGTVAARLRHLPLPGPDGQPAPPADTMDTILELNPDGTFGDTLIRFPQGQSFTTSAGRGQIRVFAAESQWALMPGGGVLTGVNDNFRISAYDSDGNLELIMQKPFEPQSVTEEDKEAILDAMGRLASQFGAPASRIAALRQAMQFADNFPAFLQIFAGPAGTTWVQQIQAPSTLSEEERENLNPQLGGGLTSPNWDVFDGDGRYLGVMTMPERFQPVQFVQNDIYGIWRDDLDVQYVMKVNLMQGDGAGIPLG